MATTLTLKQDVWIGGVKQLSGASVTVDESLAASLIAENKAIAPDGWNLFSGGPPERVLDVSGNAVGINHAVGLNYPKSTKFGAILTLSQSGGPSVLPVDYSPNKTQVSFGGNVATPWVNAGYFTSDAGNQSYLSVPNSAFDPNLYTDSFIISFVLNKNTEAGSGTSTLLGNVDGSAAQSGIFMLYGQTSNANANKLGVRIMGGSTAIGVGNTSLTSATYATAATLVDDNDHTVMVAWDAVTKVVKLYIDGKNVYKSGVLAVTESDKVTGNFRLGQGLTGVSVAAKFAGLTLVQFKNSGLPATPQYLADQRFFL